MKNIIDFPLLGIVISGVLCALSIYTSNKEGLSVAQTIAAIAGTAFQTQVNATRRNNEEGDDYDDSPQ